MQVTTTQTRQCPFCAETILAAAIKCRYCGEFLNTERAKVLFRQAEGGQAYSNQNSSEQQQGQLAQPGEGLYSGQPSLWVMTAAFLKGGLLLAIAVLLIFWHIERIPWLHLSAQNADAFAKWRLILGLGIGLITALVLFFKAMQVRMTHYEVSPDRIEFGTGIFDRRIDNLDMFRIVDIKLRRGIWDCIVGVGTVLLTTTDKSHPEFVFEKVKNARELYDVIKKASLSADRRTNVIHME